MPARHVWAQSLICDSKLGNDVVTLLVGAERKPYTVHKDLLIHESKYFERLFSGQWKESSATQPLELLEADHRIFPVFLDWLYFRRFPISPKFKHCHMCGKEVCTKISTSCTDILELDDLSAEDDAHLEAYLDTVNEHFWLTPLYIFADKFDFPGLREVLVSDRWRRHAKHGFVLTYFIAINNFRKLPASSPMCRFTLDAFTDGWKTESHVCEFQFKLRSKLPPTFVFKLAANLAKRSQEAGSEKAVGPLCSYHEHAQDAETIAACMENMSKLNQAVRIFHPNVKKLQREFLGEGGPKTGLVASIFD